MENTAQAFNNSTDVEVAKQPFFVAVFGQFATKVFWRDLAGLLVKEAISNFISILGGTLIYSVQKRVTGESVGIRRIVDGNAHPGQVLPQASPSQAFSSGYTPQPTYKPTYQATQGVAPSYPGFGN